MGQGQVLFSPFPVPVGQVWYNLRWSACPTGKSKTCPTGTGTLHVPPGQVVLVPVGQVWCRYHPVVPYQKTKVVPTEFQKFLIKKWVSNETCVCVLL